MKKPTLQAFSAYNKREIGVDEMRILMVDDEVKICEFVQACLDLSLIHIQMCIRDRF